MERDTHNYVESLSRRIFLRNSFNAGVGLTIAVALPLSACASHPAAAPAPEAPVMPPQHDLVANAFVTVTPDDKVIVTIKHLEMGQGAYTGLCALVAEEMDAAWSQVEAVNAPADARKYANLNWGGAQGVGGSSGLANSYLQMREAGATARYLLVSAAAREWQVPRESISVSKGRVLHPESGRSASFGELATAAGSETLPENVHLKNPKDFDLIGTVMPRKDIGKTDGSALFTQDVRLPDMVTAVIAHPPRFGATVKSVDKAEAMKTPGVLAVVTVPSGVAVIARDFWQAQKARAALKIQWDESKAFTLGSKDILKQYHAAVKKPGQVATSRGDLKKGFAQAHKVIEATYEFPYLAHATMEPLDCVVQIKPDGVQVWNGCQMQTGDQMALAHLFGLKPEQVKIDTLYAGGSFGRRANSHSDYVLEAAQIAKAYGKGVPVKLVWTRENDTQAGYYRPLYVHRIKAGLNRQGEIVAWQHHIVGQSILKGSPFSAMIRNGIDATSVEGAANLPYAIPNFQVELTTTDIPVPVLWWRSVGSTHTAYATEHFLDRLAHAAGKDPVQFRLGLLQKEPRHVGVLKLAAEKAGWGNKQPKGTVLGVALHKSFNTYVAQVAQLEKQPNGRFKIAKVVCAVDCGVAVTPDVIRAQMEGGIGYGLSPTLMSAITLDQGKVVQSNFHDYQVLRMKDMPAIDVHIVPSAEPPTGVGEPGTPVIAPAVANALLTATGKPHETLPIGSALFS